MRLAPVPRLAAAAWVATLLLLLPTGVFVGLVAELDATNVLDALLFGAVMQGMATLGVLIARREPRNPIGWIFCAVPALVAVAIASGVYATWADDHHPGAPGAAAADWVSSWTWVVGLAAYALLIPLLFPDGRPPGPRWRLVAGADLAAIAWIAALAGVSDTPPQPVVVVTGVLVAVLIAAGLASAVLRYRRADVTQRVQIRECVFAACAAFVGFFAISVIAPARGAVRPRLRAPAAVGRPRDAPLPALRRRRDHPTDARLRDASWRCWRRSIWLASRCWARCCGISPARRGRSR